MSKKEKNKPHFLIDSTNHQRYLKKITSANFNKSILNYNNWDCVQILKPALFSST